MTALKMELRRGRPKNPMPTESGIYYAVGSLMATAPEIVTVYADTDIFFCSHGHDEYEVEDHGAFSKWLRPGADNAWRRQRHDRYRLKLRIIFHRPFRSRSQ